VPAKVKGALLRKELQALVDAGRHAEVRTLPTAAGISAADRKALASVHPMVMGGNFLPDTQDGEVEIERVSIEPTTCDVSCVYARPDADAIHHRVVDEYGGRTLQGTTQARTEEPMTLGEFADFVLGARPLLDVPEINFDDDVDASLDFFAAECEFYPDFDRRCRHRRDRARPGAAGGRRPGDIGRRYRRG
jgi:hypothetical protein